MLYVRTTDDAGVTHASGSTTQQTTLCGKPEGRVRLDFVETHTFDPVSSTSTLERKPVPVSTPKDVTCPDCAARLAPTRIKPMTAAPAKPRTSRKKIPPKG